MYVSGNATQNAHIKYRCRSRNDIILLKVVEIDERNIIIYSL